MISRRGAALLLGGALATACLATPAAAEKAPPQPKVERQTLHLTWKGRNFRVYVLAPVEAEPPKHGYPIFYTTDANGMFETLAQTAVVQAHYRPWSHVPPAILVGIDHDSDDLYHPARQHDLAPPRKDGKRKGKKREDGGADDLLDFILKDLKPRLDKTYRIDHDRQTLFGHSRGGLFVLHTLFTRPKAFQTYVAASPAIWWNDHQLLDSRDEYLEHLKKDAPRPRVMILVGAEETKEMNKDAKAMAKALNAGGQPTVFRRYEDENHISVIPPSVSAAVRFALGEKSEKRD